MRCHPKLHLYMSPSSFPLNAYLSLCRCKYENQVFPLHAPRRREEEIDVNESMNAQVKATGTTFCRLSNLDRNPFIPGNVVRSCTDIFRFRRASSPRHRHNLFATVAARASQEGTLLPVISERGPETKKGKHTVFLYACNLFDLLPCSRVVCTR